MPPPTEFLLPQMGGGRWGGGRQERGGFRFSPVEPRELKQEEHLFISGYKKGVGGFLPTVCLPGRLITTLSKSLVFITGSKAVIYFDKYE